MEAKQIHTFRCKSLFFLPQATKQVFQHRSHQLMTPKFREYMTHVPSTTRKSTRSNALESS